MNEKFIMASSGGVIINIGKYGALQRFTKYTSHSRLLGRFNYKSKNISNNSFSTGLVTAKEGGGFFQSFFGKNVELQHAPHKQVYI